MENVNKLEGQHDIERVAKKNAKQLARRLTSSWA
jgi:hypothetical protein